MSPKEEVVVGVRARSVLWYLAFIGFAMNYMIRINMNIAIVDMISDEFKSKAISRKSHMSECYSGNVTANSTMFDPPIIEKETVVMKKDYFSVERRILDYFKIHYERNGFAWNSLDQNKVSGAFFILHWATQLPGGILAARYGTKLIFGLANWIGCVTCIFVPMAAYLSFETLICLRLIQGFVAGAAWPSMSHLVGRWIPPNERSKFITAYMGSSIGVAITYPIFGFIMEKSSWENVFHFCAIVGTIWYAAWLYFVYDLPELHPRIDPNEKEYILSSLGTSVARGEKKPLSVPWRAILTSRASWMNIVAQWGGVWGLFTLIAQAPSYFRLVHGWGIEMTGLLSGLPHLFRVIFSLAMSYVCDYLLTAGKMSRTNVRKLATFFSLILNGFAVLGLALAGCHVALAVVLLTISLMLHGAVSSGALASVVDISPNFAGVLLGINSSFSVLTGYISPHIVGLLTLNRQTSLEAWQHVFEIVAAMQLVCGVLYLLFSDSSLQEWNRPQNLPPLDIPMETTTTTDANKNCVNGVGKSNGHDNGVFVHEN